MESQLLVKELERLRGGQAGAESRVLFLISRSSLHLLSETPVNQDDESTSFVVKLRLIDVDGHPTASLFSSLESLQEWCAANGVEPHAFPIHGADMQFALPQGTWIQIDPGTPHAATLGPDMLSKINEEPSGGMGVILSPVEDKGFTSPLDDLEKSNAPAVYKPIEEELKQQPEGPSKRRFIPRSHPTTLFTAPVIEKKDAPQGRQRTYTSSNLKKIIRPGKPDGDEE